MNNDTSITDLEYALIEPKPWETNPMAVMAYKDDSLLLYRITFSYEGHNGVMLSLISKEME